MEEFPAHFQAKGIQNLFHQAQKNMLNNERSRIIDTYDKTVRECFAGFDFMFNEQMSLENRLTLLEELYERFPGQLYIIQYNRYKRRDNDIGAVFVSADYMLLALKDIPKVTVKRNPGFRIKTTSL